MGLPQISASGFPGKREEAQRAGMTAAALGALTAGSPK